VEVSIWFWNSQRVSSGTAGNAYWVSNSTMSSCAGKFFNVRKLLLKTTKVFTVNHGSAALSSLGWTIFDANQKGFYKISTEPLFSQNLFWGFCLLPDRRTHKKVLENTFFFRVGIITLRYIKSVLSNPLSLALLDANRCIRFWGVR
jgi:hypothetical protein